MAMLTDPLTQYPAVYRSIGGRQIVKQADIPDASLGIGEAEFLAPAPIIYEYHPAGQSNKALIPPIETQDDLFAINAGKPVKLSDFAVDYYFGEVIE